MLHLHVCGPVWPILVDGVSQSQRPPQRGVELKPAYKLESIKPLSPEALHNYLITVLSAGLVRISASRKVAIEPTMQSCGHMEMSPCNVDWTASGDSLGALGGEGWCNGCMGLLRQGAGHGSTVGVHGELLRPQKLRQHLGVAHHNIPGSHHLIPATAFSASHGQEEDNFSL